MIYLIISFLLFIILFLLVRLLHYERNLKEISQYIEDQLNGKYAAQILQKAKGSIGRLIKDLNLLSERLETKSFISEEKGELLNTLFKEMNEGLILTKIDGEIVQVNSSIKKIFGEDVLQKGKMIQELIIHHEFIEFTNRPKDGKKNESMELELPDLGKSFIISRVYLEYQQLFFFLFYDNTDAKNLKRIKADFITNLSHELRTPLTAIKGYIEALEEPDLNERNRAKFIRIVRENIERLTNIVSDLLLLSDIERPERKIKRERLDLNELTDEVILLLRRTAEQKGLSLNFIPAKIPEYYGDRFLLLQLLINLVSNGIRFTERGGVEVDIKYENQRFYITVSDTGIGIPTEEIPKIFERFYTVDKARSRLQGGTGLGLAIVKHIVQLHQGDIKVESRLREGTKFTIILPLI